MTGRQIMGQRTGPSWSYLVFATDTRTYIDVPTWDANGPTVVEIVVEHRPDAAKEKGE